nr:hypothetical protein [Synechococcus sp. CS-602]
MTKIPGGLLIKQVGRQAIDDQIGFAQGLLGFFVMVDPVGIEPWRVPEFNAAPGVGGDGVGCDIS